MLKRVIFVVLLTVAAAMPLKAQVYQEWIQYYNGWVNGSDVLAALAVDGSGNVHVTGTSSNNYLTIKYDSNGNQIWSAQYNGPGNYNDEAVDIALDGSGNVYVTGRSYGSGNNSDYATIKYDANGNQVWVARFNWWNSDEAAALALDSSGNVYVTGLSVDDYFDYATIKYDNDGNQLWVARYSGPGNPSDDRPRDIAVDDGGNVCVTGASGVYSNNEEITTVKYDSNGNQLWAARYPMSDEAWDEGTSIAFDDSGNVYVAGCWDVHFATIKYDPAGTQLWAAVEECLGAHALALGADGGVYVTGDGCHTYKYDGAGNLLWQADYGSGYDDDAYSIALDDSGNAYVAGRLYPYMGNSNCFAVKYDLDGNQIWAAIHDGPVNSYDEAISIAVDDSSKVYVGGTCTVGTYYSWPYWYNDAAYTTIKYYQTAQPQLDVTLTPINPPITIPSGGGSFDFNATVTNISGSTQSTQAWIMVQLPSLVWYGPVLGPVSLILPGGASIIRLRTQSVPASAPAGLYTYRAYLGSYPATMIDSSSFPFTKLGSNRDWLGSDGWVCSGKPFPGENATAGELHPSSFILHPCSPNPFNPSTAISYQLPANSFVSLRVYDTAGRLVQTLVDGWRAAGAHEVTFDASGLAAGIYFARLEAGEYVGVEKLVLLK